MMKWLDACRLFRRPQIALVHRLGLLAQCFDQGGRVQLLHQLTALATGDDPETRHLGRDHQVGKVQGGFFRCYAINARHSFAMACMRCGWALRSAPVMAWVSLLHQVCDSPLRQQPKAPAGRSPSSCST
jgi:hypothetical protein